MRHIFGPVPSRRFGLSLGIDLSPEQKSCNFDCLYCELEPAKPTDTIPHPASPDTIAQEAQEALRRHPDVEVLTITANGEPTLYPYLDELIIQLNNIKNDKKLLILSNASTIHDPKIQNSLQKLDIVKLSLDCATPRCFRRLDRPLKNIQLPQIIEGMERFRQIYKGLLVIEILVVQGLNDNPEEFEKLGHILRKIGPDRIDLGTIDRPPAYDVKPVSYKRLFELAQYLNDIPVSIITRQHHRAKKLTLNEKELLHLFDLRPLSQEDIQSLFDASTLSLFHSLLDKNIIAPIRIGALTFYKKIEQTN